VVRRGDTLWEIAASKYGDPTLWPRIFEANRNRIRNPNLIYPDQELVIPNQMPKKAAPSQPLARHRVKPGETLWEIAASKYKDPTLWPRIYEANREYLSGPDLILPNQELLIPTGHGERSLQ